MTGDPPRIPQPSGKWQLAVMCLALATALAFMLRACVLCDYR
jgi:hypothetical protein